MSKDLPGTVYFPGMEPIARAPIRVPIKIVPIVPIENPKPEETYVPNDIPASPEKAPEEKPEPRRKPVTRRKKVERVIEKTVPKRSRSIQFIRLAAALLAALAALMSWYYSFEWFKDKLPGAWRFFLPIIIVGCSVLLPEVALILLGRKGWKTKLAAPIILIIGILASSFSMLSTIAGIYNANSEAINLKSTALISSQTDEDARYEVARIDAELVRLNAEIDATQAKVDSIAVSDTLKGDSQALMRRLNAAKKSKQDYETKRATAQGAIEAARATGYTAETVREDFNSFMGRIFKTDSGKIEFGMAAAPAVLLDVVAPILAAVALFL